MSERIEIDDLYGERKCNSSADGKPPFIAAIEVALVITSRRIKSRQVLRFFRDTLKVLARCRFATKKRFIRSTFLFFIGIEGQAAHISGSTPDLWITPHEYSPAKASKRLRNRTITPWSGDLLLRSPKRPAARLRRLSMATQLPIRYGHRHSALEIRSGSYPRQCYMSRLNSWRKICNQEN